MDRLGITVIGCFVNTQSVVLLLFILQDGVTALMLASKGGHTEIVLLLLEHLAEINVVNVASCVLEH